MNNKYKRSKFYAKHTYKGESNLDLFSNSWTEFLTRIREDTDRTFVVTGKYEGRLDLISFLYYGTTDIWWLLGMVNRIIDPISEIVAGKELLIPDQSLLDSYYQRVIKISRGGQVARNRQIL